MERVKLTHEEMLQKETDIQNQNPFAVHNHLEVVDVREDYAEVRVDLVPESMNFRGTVHGATFFMMGDVCSGMVCRTDGRVYATQQANVLYVRAVSGGRLTGRGTVIHRGRTGCTVEVRITTEEGKLAFMGTYLWACIG